MAKLTDYTRYADAQAHANSAALWDLFDGNREFFNIAHESITRHADGSGRTAVRIAHSDGRDEILSFDQIAAGSARFAHWLVKHDIKPGDLIAFLLRSAQRRVGKGVCSTCRSRWSACHVKKKK